MDKPIHRAQTKKIYKIMPLQKEQYPCMPGRRMYCTIVDKKEKAKRTLCQVGIGIVGLPYGAK